VKYDRDVAVAVVARLREQREESGGRLPDGALSRSAEFLGVPAPTLSRWVTHGVPPARRQMARYDLEHDDEARAILYEKNKSRAAAHAELVRVRGDCAPSPRTLQRAYRRLPRGVQAAIEDGDAGWRQHQPARRYEAGFRNEHWQADHQAMEIWVKPPSKRARPVRPWLTIFVDCYSRAIMSYVVSLRPTCLSSDRSSSGRVNRADQRSIIDLMFTTKAASRSRPPGSMCLAERSCQPETAVEQIVLHCGTWLARCTSAWMTPPPRHWR